MHFLKRKHCNKALLNRRKLQKLEKEKHGFIQNTKVFINENLTVMKENIAFNGRKLKRSGLVHSSFTIDGIVHIIKSENNKPRLITRNHYHSSDSLPETFRSIFRDEIEF